MKNRKKSLPALGAFFVAAIVALAVSACGGSSVPSNSVAVVAGNAISTQALNHWMYVDAKGEASQSPGTPVIVPNDPPQFNGCIAQARADIASLKKTATKTLRADCKQLFTSYVSQVMDFLIKAYWYQAEAHKLGITISNAQVQKDLATAKKGQFQTAAQYSAFLKASGETEQDVEYRIRISDVYKKLEARHMTSVTPTAIATYYNSHKSQFGTAESRNVRIVLTKTSAQAAAAKQALQRGQSWKVVAKKYSTDATTKNNGGLLTGVTATGSQDTALSKAAFAASLNKLTGPIKGSFGYYVIDVIKITPATQKSLAQSSATIKQTLTQSATTNAQTAVDAQAKKAWLSSTTCRSLYAMADCKGYKAPKTSTSTAPAGASTAPATGGTSTVGGSTATAPPTSATTTATTSSK